MKPVIPYLSNFCGFLITVIPIKMLMNSMIKAIIKKINMPSFANIADKIKK